MSDARAANQLETLAEEELGLLAAGRVDELAELQARRDVLLAQLPELVVEPGDREALARAHAMQVQVTALLERATAEMATRLTRLDHGRTSMRAYATALKQA
jgi:flagellar biosynthesis/type III secretory pathway chaperone